MRKKLAILAALLAVSLSSQTTYAEPLKIRLSYIVPVSNWATILFQKPGLARHLGKTYTFEALHFHSSPIEIQALASGELEIANLGFTSLPIAITNAHMSDLRIIADETQDGVPGYYSDEYLVRKDSPIKTIEDLRGKVVTDGGQGGGLDVAMRVMLAKHGLTVPRDVTIIESPIPAAPAMLAEHKVDLMALPLPFTESPKVKAEDRTLFTQRDAMGITQLGMWVARSGFIKEHRAALADFMEDALRAERWYFDPAHHEEAVKIAAEVSKLPAPVWDSWLFKKAGQGGDYYRSPDGTPDIAGLQKSIDEQVKYGLLKQNVDIRKYVDLSLVREAAKRLDAESTGKSK
jgi:ABC-type nitrate/sulfonate/bicarbonate transport system substrate-binding protein